LPKILIRGESIGQACIVPDQEGDAIRKAPALVRPLAVQVPATLPERRLKGTMCTSERWLKWSIRATALARHAGRARALAVSTSTALVVVSRPVIQGFHAWARWWCWSCFTTKAIQ
jgi:hypothetical protein